MFNRYHEEFERRRLLLMQNSFSRITNPQPPHSVIYAEKRLSEQSLLQLKEDFNDIVMRELGLDITEDKNYLYKMDNNEIIQINGKYIKYSTDGFVDLRANELDLNLIEDPRIMEILFADWIENHPKVKNVTSFYQSIVRGTNKGFFVATRDVDGKITDDLRSDVFTNESVRIFNLICKINHTTHMYDLARFDIEIEKK